jgi:hypothetical protein
MPREAPGTAGRRPAFARSEAASERERISDTNRSTLGMTMPETGSPRGVFSLRYSRYHVVEHGAHHGSAPRPARVRKSFPPVGGAAASRCQDRRNAFAPFPLPHGGAWCASRLGSAGGACARIISAGGRRGRKSLSGQAKRVCAIPATTWWSMVRITARLRGWRVCANHFRRRAARPQVLVRTGETRLRHSRYHVPGSRSLPALIAPGHRRSARSPSAEGNLAAGYR